MRSRRMLEASVILGIGLAAQGCYWPVASCSEHDDVELVLAYSTKHLEVEPGGGLLLDGVGVASCSDLCAKEPGVVRVVSCEPPVSTTDSYKASQWTIVCHVDQESCHLPTIFNPSFGGGRRPEGLARAAGRPLSPGAWLVELARLEAASVPAFDRLARELAHHRAPAELVRGALRAKADEIRHARIASRLARRFGAQPATLVVGELGVRALVDVAIENAVEGCVGETVAASLAAFQARMAGDFHVRRAMTRIQHDETGHAVLAWNVLAWTLERLEASERARVIGALREAAARLDPAAIAGATPEVRSALGVPSVDQAAAILSVARQRLFASDGGDASALWILEKSCRDVITGSSVPDRV